MEVEKEEVEKMEENVDDSDEDHHDEADDTPKKRKADEEESNKTKKPKKEKKVFIYGNYDHYYGYRSKSKPICIDNPTYIDQPDKRIAILEKDWFCSKKCLDIGCNSGHITLEFARLFNPSSIHGIDIDAKLIEKAKEKLQLYNEKARTTAEYPKSFELTLGPLPKKMVYLRNLSFSASNILELNTSEKYDLILCTTKWIHFNWGDNGVKALFAKVDSLLNSGGIFVLEPQPWDTYKTKAGITPAIRENYRKIEFKPDQFANYLVHQFKYTLIKSVDIPPDSDTTKGFARPVLVFKK